MDAHDIFKKLTKGAYFSRKNNNNNKRKFEKKIVVDIKDEEQPEDVKVKEEEIEDDGNDSNNLKDDGDDTEFVYLNKDENEAEPPKKKKKKSDNVETKRKLLEQEELNHLRNIHRISVSGKQVPAPIKTFDELETDYNVPSKLIDNLAACGYPIPTPIQMQAIPIMLQGKSLMACAPTGSGKTVAFLTPILRDLKGPQKKGFRAIILCPTRELAQQTYRECLRLTEKIGLKTHMISKASQAEQKFGEKSNKKYDILVSTPNRVCYLLNHDPPILDFKNVEWFIVDEADKLMEEGMNSFKEQFDQILNACSNPNRKVGLFSATYTVPVAKWALRNLKGLIRCTVGERNAATETVQQELLFVGCESGKLLAFRDLVRGGLQPPVLVFVQSKERAKQLFGELIYDGINVDVIHAERTQQQRDNVVRAFREGKIWVLICTELMGRGIDFKGVNLVVNYDFPPTSISYIHRVGRTGRAGRPGRAITYFTQDDTVNLRSIAHIIRNSGGQVPEFMLKLKKTKKSERKELAKRAPERENITTVPKFELERREQLKKADEAKRKDEKKNFVAGKKAKTIIGDDLKTLTKKKRGFMKTKKIKA